MAPYRHYTDAEPLEDISARSGITAVLHNAATPEKHQIETMAGGLAVIDFDNDGHPDLFLTNGAPQPSLHKSGPEWWNRLYRNRGDGTFEDVTAKAGIPHTGWAVAGVFFDADNDGFLDLLIVNYVKWDPATEPFCGDPALHVRTYCHPRFYEPLPNVMLHNNGDGTFTDVSQSSGIGAYRGKGMGAAINDYDGDGRMDVILTNDTTPNFLFHNEGGMKFREVGMTAGVALNEDGRALSSMGVDFRDVDNDGRPDVFLTALSNETYPLFRNLGAGLFKDVTYSSRIGAQTMALTGWGAGIYDFDNDGLKDLFAANGDVNTNTELFSSRASKQRCTIFRQKADGRFEAREIGDAAWHRGAAFADFTGDGLVDVAVARLEQTPALFLNHSGVGKHWIAFSITGTRSNRDGIGARIHLFAPSGEQWNLCTTAVGYASASEKTVRFGLGSDTRVMRAEIEWPSGARQTIKNLQIDRVVTVREPARP